MKTILFGTLLVAGIGAASAQSVPRDRPDAHAVDTGKVATVEQWSKRRGSKVIWSQDPQRLAKTSAVDNGSRVDAGAVEAVDQQSKERGHRQVWFKYPEKRTQAVAVNHASASRASTRPAASPVAKKKAAEPSAKTDDDKAL
ncbi:hypothetical protein [Dokdonella sp.]|uniref:hypothetical protein n=1 Tax=Dokdonella sp. TaxID=2291710 RepID=UPI001B04DD7D|nr:hypothetical protein [Dokdonella sp.]MBO9663527.1 hypothetical protein [Dokdonella sp.]